MGRKAKFSFELKMDIVLRCLNGITTANHEGKRLGINPSRIYEWIALYQSLGADGLITTSKNATYSAALKANAVRMDVTEAACVTHGGVIMSMLSQRALPSRRPEQRCV